MPPARSIRAAALLWALLLWAALAGACAQQVRLPASVAEGLPSGSVEQLRGDVPLVMLSGWRGEDTLGIGSGVRIAPDLILTAAHVVDNTRIQMVDNRRARLEEVARGEAPEDWVVLRLVRGRTSAPVAVLADRPDLDAPLTLHGFTGTDTDDDGNGRVVRMRVDGRVVRPGFDARHVPPGAFVVSDGAWIGMSGGPAINSEGEVVGISITLLTNVLGRRTVVQGIHPEVIALARSAGPDLASHAP